MDRPVALESRSVDLAIEPAFELGRARVEPEAHEYTIDGKATRIQPQALKVLIALHHKTGRVVSRDELIDRCWNGRIVGDDVINRCISLLRSIAAESGGFRIETISGAGYRLTTEATPARLERRKRGWMMLGSAAAIAAALGSLALFEHTRRADAQTLVGVEPLMAPSGDAAALALGQGLRSSIERDLAGTGTPVEIVDGNSRSVPLQVRGTSITDHGELHASVELVAGDSGKVIWASNFERPVSQLNELEDQLSLRVARELHCAYSEGRGPFFDADLEFAKLSLAHCDYLGPGRGETVLVDSRMVQRAPGFARAWAEYAMDSALQAFELPPLLQAAAERRAIALAHHALALDPHQGLAYTAIGVATEESASWLDNERLVRRALIADPGSPEAHNWQSGQLVGIGRLQDALNEATISYQYDHFLPGKIDQLVRINIASGNFDDAQDQLALARRNWPESPWWDSDTVLLGLYGNSPRPALRLLTTRHVRTSGAREHALLAFLRWRIAPAPAAKLAAIDAIEAASRQGDPTTEQVDLLAALGNLNAAYQLAARLPSSAKPDPLWFIPNLAAFRADPRFMPLAARDGLAQNWLQTGLWPDFCREELTLANCKAAAEVAVAEHAKAKV